MGEVSLCGLIEEDMEYHTGAFLRQVEAVESVAACCAQCDGDPLCGAWTYGSKRGMPGLTDACLLRRVRQGEKPRKLEREGIISGLPSRERQKHGVLSGLLAKELAKDGFRARSVSAEPLGTNETCAGQVNVTGHGLLSVINANWSHPGEPAQGVGVPQGAWALVPRLGGRAYLAESCTAASYIHGHYAAVKLLGKTLRFRTDVSGTGCGCNAQLHLVPMRQNNWKSHCEDYYCGATGAAKSCGVPCAEIDIQNSNQYAWSSSLHVHDDELGANAGYGGSGLQRWNESQYGPGADCIDTTWPFEVTVSFPVDDGGKLAAVEVSLSQEGHTCQLKAHFGNYSFQGRDGLEELTTSLEAGMTPVVSYWSSRGLLWMDGTGADGGGPCVRDSPGTCPEAVRFFDFAVEAIEEGSEGTQNSPISVALAAIHSELEKEGDALRAAELRNATADIRAGTPESIAGALGTTDPENDCKPRCDTSGLEVLNNTYGEMAVRQGGAGTERRRDGNVEWEVAVARVPVLRRPDHSAELVDERLKGMILFGIGKGDWLILSNASGYVPLHMHGKEVLRNRIVSYDEVSHGSCADSHMFPIVDTNTCQAAAFAMGYFDTSVEIYRGKEERPEGCHLWRGELWLAVDKDNEGNGAAHGRTSICSSKGYAKTTTTTTVTTTSTVTTTTTQSSTTTTTSTTWGSPSIFCFSVMRTTGYELGLVREQIRHGAGIFKCDEHAIFSQDGKMDLGRLPWGTHVETNWFEKAAVWVSRDNTAANTLLFLHIWKAVKKHGVYNRHGWTVKADPDAVVMASRLRKHLSSHTGSKNYLVNCNKYPGTKNFPMIYGALEAYSREAMNTYFDSDDRCQSKLKWQEWGEDFFMGRCMKLLEVNEFDDFTVLSDKRCMGAHCGDGVSGAYHDFKSIDSWFKCWDEANS